MASTARLVALPLCALALVLALIAVTSSGGDMLSELAAKKVASASAKKVCSKYYVGIDCRSCSLLPFGSRHSCYCIVAVCSRSFDESGPLVCDDDVMPIAAGQADSRPAAA